jgi:hypothetical protein
MRKSLLSYELKCSYHGNISEDITMGTFQWISQWEHFSGYQNGIFRRILVSQWEPFGGNHNGNISVDITMGTFRRILVSKWEHFGGYHNGNISEKTDTAMGIFRRIPQ